jgi:hypothetical protein
MDRPKRLAAAFSVQQVLQKVAVLHLYLVQLKLHPFALCGRCEANDWGRYCAET